jgi:alpha-L-arabinofuranosidase
VETSRRGFLRDSSVLAAGSAQVTASNAIVIDPKPLFDISPYLYMQFMEPLGVTDGSVEACWDYNADDWRKDLVEVTRDLAPDVIRWGGIFSWYYKWREGVGPAKARPWMRNYVWGGKETNRVGTYEFVDFCRRVGAEPLYCVNFLSDGRRRFWNTEEGNRSGDAREAADWVSYANDPDNPERRRHGVTQPYGIKLWQIGNETSYGAEGFTRDESIAHTIEFAKAMRERDGSIQLIGWGDRGRKDDPSLWTGDLLKRAGEYLNYVAIHMMGQSSRRKNTVLRGWEYQKDPELAWQELLEISNAIEPRIKELEEVMGSQRAQIGIAITEGHLSLRPHNACPILYEWLTGVLHARTWNIYQRHGATVRIATAADFAGTRWTVNAVMIPVPGGVSYLMPVGAVTRLFKRHNGRQGLAVRSAPSDLDIAASRSGNKLYLHVANLSYRRPVEVAFAVDGMTVAGGRVFEIAADNPRTYASQEQPTVFDAVEKGLGPGPILKWRFPGASVSAVELDLKA